MRRISLELLLVLAVGGLALSTSTLVAHQGAKGIVLERMESMKAIGSAMKELAQASRNPISSDLTSIQKQALTIAKNAQVAARLFPDEPASRTSHVSEASDSIWLQRQSFDALMSELELKARALAASNEMDQSSLKGAVSEMGATCKSCHEKFRIKK